MMRMLLALVVALAPTPTVGSSVQPDEPTVAGRTVLDEGHVDLGPRFVDGAWTLQLRDDTVRPSVWRPLSDVVLQVAEAARTTVPADERFAFLGATGASLWVLPQAQQPGMLWPGWNTQDPRVATTVNREATWTLHGLTGPGHFVLFLNGNFGEPQVVFDGAKPMPQRTGVEVNTHVHGNWVFTAPGSYLLDVEMSGTTTDGREVSDRDTLRVFVGAGDATAAFATNPTTPAHATRDVQESTVLWPWLAGGGAVLLVILAGGLLTRRRASSRTGE